MWNLINDLPPNNVWVMLNNGGIRSIKDGKWNIFITESSNYQGATKWRYLNETEIEKIKAILADIKFEPEST